MGNFQKLLLGGVVKAPEGVWVLTILLTCTVNLWIFTLLFESFNTRALYRKITWHCAVADKLQTLSFLCGSLQYRVSSLLTSPWPIIISVVEPNCTPTPCNDHKGMSYPQQLLLCSGYYVRRAAVSVLMN